MAGEDPKYTAWLRTLACCKCSGPGGVAHHSTGAGMGLRAHDHKAMPMCDRCHRDFHGATGRFKGWDREERSEWQERMVAKYRAVAMFAGVS